MVAAVRSDRTSHLRASLGQGVTRLLGAKPAVYFARLATRRRLPVLAYHDIEDPAAFARHLDFVQEHYHPIGGEAVLLALRRGLKLPRDAIWLTFDDAHPGVTRFGLPLLRAQGVPATLFVCPGVVDTETPYWWQIIDASLARGDRLEFDGRSWTDRSIVTHLKRVPDNVRRAAVHRIQESQVNEGHEPVRSQQVSTRDLQGWLDVGLEIGNHTWDHPCLNTCSAAEQRRQITMADGWLRDALGIQAKLFAYPNGNTASVSANVLAELGYGVMALFDHRTSRIRGPEVSRLRIDADAPIDRLAAVASGAHPAAFGVARRLRSVPWQRQAQTAL